MRQGRIAARLPGTDAAATVRLAIQVRVTRSLALAEGAQPVSSAQVPPRRRVLSLSLDTLARREQAPARCRRVTPQPCKLGPGGSPAAAAAAAWPARASMQLILEVHWIADSHLGLADGPMRSSLS